MSTHADTGMKYTYEENKVGKNISKAFCFWIILIYVSKLGLSLVT